MRGCLIEITPKDATGASVTIRLGHTRNTRTLRADGQTWHSAVSRAPRISMDFMDDDFMGQLQVAKAAFVVATRRIQGLTASYLKTLIWDSAPVKIWSGDGKATSDLVLEFTGSVQGGAIDPASGLLPLQCEVDRNLVTVPLLNAEYGGGGGADGESEVRGQLKPACFGNPVNVPVFFFDQVNNVGQIDGYGNCTAINTLYEDAASFGTKQADYASYAALIAATIPEGSWATCVAQGMIRLGAEPRGVITCDPVCGGGTPGTMIARWLSNHAGVTAGRIDSASLTALDSALTTVLGAAPAVSYYTQSQVQVLDRMQALLAACNAVPLIGPDGKIAVTRVISSAAALLTLKRKGGTPIVLDWRTLDPPVPWWRLKAEAAKTWRVHQLSEIDYEDDLVPLGDYTPGQTYRQGNLVRLPSDGRTYLYINATPSTNAPPNVTYWDVYEDRPDASVIRYVDGTPIESLKPGEAGADVTGDNTAAAIIGQGALATANSAAWATQVSGRPANLAALIGTEALLNQQLLDVIANDDVVSITEKLTYLQPIIADLENRYQYLSARAVAMGISTTALLTARSEWGVVFNTIAGAYQTEVNTTIYTPWLTASENIPTGWAIDANGAVNGDFYDLTDNSTGNYLSAVRSQTVVGAGTNRSFGIRVKKDSVPRTTRYVGFRWFSSGTVVRYQDLYLDTSTGEFWMGSPVNGGVLAAVVWDIGTEWFVAGAIQTNNAGNNDVGFQIFPAMGANANPSSATNSASTTGTVSVRDARSAIGTRINLGRPAVVGYMSAYIRELVAVAKLISERDGTTGLVINPPPAQTIAADSSGVPKELPHNVALTASVGTATVTTLGTWSLGTLPSGVSATIGASTGALSITAFTVSNAEVPVTFVYQGVTRTAKIPFTRQDDPPATGGGSGGGGTAGSTASTSTLGDTTSTSYDLTNSVSGTMLVKTGAAASLTATTGNMSFKRRGSPSAEGQTGCVGKFQWRVPAGSWADFKTVAPIETADTNPSITTIDSESSIALTSTGSINCTQQKTGLSANTDYEVRFVWRRNDEGGTAKQIYKTFGSISVSAD